MGILQRWKLNRELKRINKYCQEKDIDKIDGAALRIMHVSNSDAELEKKVNRFAKYIAVRKPDTDDIEVKALQELQNPFYENKIREMYKKEIKPLLA